jgi:hypothetical protein
MTEDRMSLETHIELARHDERIKALAERVSAAEMDMERRLRAEATELSRRLDGLNHDLAQRKEMLTHTVDIGKFDGLKDTVDRDRGEFREFRGRMWLPTIMLSTLVSSIVVAIVKALFP